MAKLIIIELIASIMPVDTEAARLRLGQGELCAQVPAPDASPAISKTAEMGGLGRKVAHGFNANIHGARGLFACMVLVYHVVNSRLPTFAVLGSGAPFFMLRSLEHGVELFFGVSGFVMIGALARTRGAAFFLADRATRIYAVLWPSVLVIAVLAEFTHFEGRSVAGPGVLLANLLGLPPLAPFPLIHPAAWSLSYELAFYALCSLTLLGSKRWRAASMTAAVLIGLWLLNSHVRAVLMPIGLLAALLGARGRFRRWAFTAEVGLVLFLVSWEGLCRSTGGDLMNFQASLLLQGWRPLLVIAAVVGGCGLFAGLEAGRGLLCRLLRTSVFQWLGSVSYSLYLWHPIVMSMVKHAMVTAGLPHRLSGGCQLAFLLLGAPSSLLVALVSQQLLEKRLTTFVRRRLEGRKRAVEPATASRMLTQPS